MTILDAIRSGPVGERFWAKVEKTPTCWLWTAAKVRGGYGTFTLRHGRQTMAHRFAYESLVGPILAETLDHVCKNRACVNPAHLRPMSRGENSLAGDGPTAKNKRKTVCSLCSGQLTPYQYKNATWRRCKPCKKRLQDGYNAKRSQSL